MSVRGAVVGAKTVEKECREVGFGLAGTQGEITVASRI